MHDSQRVLDFPALLNARDLGGYPTTDSARTRWRSLLRSDDLAQLTPEGVQAMARYGIETVVDLRWPEEVEIDPSPVPRSLPHIRYRQISLLAESTAQWRELNNDCAKEMWKCTVLEQVRNELRDVLRFIATSSPGPLLFHCVAGKDRTGIIAALLLAVADVEPEAIAYDYAESAANLRDAYLVRYADSNPAAIIEAIRCPEEGVHNMLRYLERLGGIEAYLENIGLTAVEIAALRARLRD
jgi:protein-tyrosine phosphatase